MNTIPSPSLDSMFRRVTDGHWRGTLARDDICVVRDFRIEDRGTVLRIVSRYYENGQRIRTTTDDWGVERTDVGEVVAYGAVPIDELARSIHYAGLQLDFGPPSSR